MFEKNIQKTSIIINKNNYLKALSILALSIVFTILFSITPFVLDLILNNTIIPVKLNNINPLLPSTINILFLIIVSILALICFSSISCGEKAWYSGFNKKNIIRTKRFIFWIKPNFSLKAFRLKTLKILLKLYWFGLFSVPSIVFFTTLILLAFTGGVETYLFISILLGALFLLILSVLFTFIISQRYFLADYLLIENPHLGIVQVLKQSKNLMEGQIFRVVKFKLLFLPSFILCFLIFPIFFIYHHYKQSRCLLANELRL